MDQALLDLLLRASEPLTEQTLTAQLDLTPAQVRGALRALTDAGCALDAPLGRGIRLRRTGIAVWADYLQWRDAQSGRGDPARRIEVYRSTASTQDVARRMVTAYGRDADGALAVADEQTAGRGRLGRRWLAPPGACLTFTRAMVSAAGAALPSIDHIMLSSAVAVAQAVEAMIAPSQQRVGIKWPNDIIIDGGKIAGILVETFTHREQRAALIGIGINCDLPAGALQADVGPVTSLAALGCEADRLLLLAAVTAELDRLLAQSDVEQLAAAWRARSTLLEHRVTIAHDGREHLGTVVDIDPHEGLILRTDYGQMLHLPAATSTIVRVAR